jgi:hypothetical protein
MEKLIGTLANYGWEPGVWKNPNFGKTAGNRLNRWAYFVVSPMATWGCSSKQEADGVWEQVVKGEIK